MYNLIQSRAKTLLLWGSIEALLGGLAWQSYRKPSPVLLSLRSQQSQLQQTRKL